MDSRLRGNDINGIFSVIPAQAGIHAVYPNTNAAAVSDVRTEAEPNLCLGRGPNRAWSESGAFARRACAFHPAPFAVAMTPSTG